VYNFVRLAELYYAGSHGMDIKGPAKGPVYTTKDARAVLFQPASEFVPMIDELCKILVQKTSSVEGVSVENNKFCLSVHYRRVDEKVCRLYILFSSFSSFSSFFCELID